MVVYNGDSLPSNFNVPQASMVCVPASEIADQLGDAKAANMVMLGALLELASFPPVKTALAVLEASVHNETLLEVDRQALEAGGAFIRKAASDDVCAQVTGPLPGQEVS